MATSSSKFTAAKGTLKRGTGAMSFLGRVAEPNPITITVPAKSKTTSPAAGHLSQLIKKPVRTVEAAVTLCLPELEQVEVQSPNGDQYIIGPRTKGVSWARLHEGQIVRCVVSEEPLPVVLYAEVS